MTAFSLSPGSSTDARLADRASTVIVLLFWLAQYTIVTTVDHIATQVAILFLPRILISTSGFLISLAIARLLARIRLSFALTSIVMQGVLALGLAVLGGFAQASTNYLIFRSFAPEMRTAITPVVYLRDTLHWFWIYAALIGIIQAFDYGRDLADRERRIATLDRIANEAQLRALRYQLNPHFMFNTLNSIAALVERNDGATAGRMIEDLADFLRATLATDPAADIPLSRELELQSLYLAIERRRFPDRLHVDIDVSDEAARALVPSLITQPLTENVIRHAVAQTPHMVSLRVTGTCVGDRLRLMVSNTAPEGVSRANGTHVGLANVAERLRARYGGDASFDASPQPDGGYAVTITMPFEGRP